jgi:hypothetical protein
MLMLHFSQEMSILTMHYPRHEPVSDIDTVGWIV